MSQGTTPNAYRYTGQQSDADSGLLYLRARYYEPSTGRFISQDLYKGDHKDPATLNLYVYCKNNPIKSVDPSGLKDYVFYGRPSYEGGMHELIAKTFAKKFKVCAKEVGSLKDILKNIKEPVDHLIIVSHCTGDRLLLGDKSFDIADVKNLYGQISFNFKGVEVQVEIYGCFSAGFAKEFFNTFGVTSVGLNAGGMYSSSQLGQPGEGLPEIVPADYKNPVYMVPNTGRLEDINIYFKIFSRCLPAPVPPGIPGIPVVGHPTK